jgi:large subunit ribosomal protein L21
MSFAIIETGGKQYKIAAGQVLTIEKLPKPEKGGSLVFDKVLMISDGKKVQVGTPYLDKVLVSADFVDEGKGKKVRVIRYKNKTRYKKIKGHRQPYTKVKVGQVA